MGFYAQLKAKAINPQPPLPPHTIRYLFHELMTFVHRYHAGTTSGPNMKNLQLKLLQRTLEKALFGVAVSDSSGRFIYVNGVFSAQFDLRIEDLLGFSYQLLHPQLGHLPNFHDLFKSKVADMQEHVLYRSRAGVTRHLVLHSNAFEEDGESFHAMSVVDLQEYPRSSTKSSRE